MKLVGAANWFVKAPYLIQVVIFTFIACLMSLLLVYPFINFIQPFINEALQTNELNLLVYFNSKIFIIFSIQFVLAALFGVFSSNFATRRYLKV